MVIPLTTCGREGGREGKAEGREGQREREEEGRGYTFHRVTRVYMCHCLTEVPMWCRAEWALSFRVDSEQETNQRTMCEQNSTAMPTV